MATLRRQTVFSPSCLTLDARLAPSGNFLSHGLADVTREVHRLEHHHTEDHSAADREAMHDRAVAMHEAHIVAGTVK